MQTYECVDWLNEHFGLDPAIEFMQVREAKGGPVHVRVWCRGQEWPFVLGFSQRDIRLYLQGDVETFGNVCLAKIVEEHERHYGPDVTACVDLASWRPGGYWAAYDD